jgi:hypothetical protein
MFRIFFTNFDYYYQDDFQTFNDALVKVRSCGFEALIIGPNGYMVAAWSVLAGLHIF